MDLPRPLRSPQVLSDVETFDADFKARRLTGSITIEIHYRTGAPLRTKVERIHDHVLTEEDRRS